MKCIYLAAFHGARAELADWQVGRLLVALGWRFPWRKRLWWWFLAKISRKT